MKSVASPEIAHGQDKINIMKKQGKYTEVEYTTLKEQKKFYFQQIETANQGLRDIRRLCDHPETEFVTYSTRPGQNWDNTEICSICGEVVNWPQDNWRHKVKEDEK